MRRLAFLAVLAHGHTQTVGAYIILREDYADFQARGCAPSYLHDPLVQLLTASERRVLVADLPSAMAATVRAGL